MAHLPLAGVGVSCSAKGPMGLTDEQVKSLVAAPDHIGILSERFQASAEPSSPIFDQSINVSR